ncbi:hypothetical protein BB560_000964 [Smittium megazygosporum]|nr:hypothetical protein BB560_000964 [Smittium megazygosporum]
MFLGIAFNNRVLLDGDSVAPLPHQLVHMLSPEWEEIRSCMETWSAEVWMDYCVDLFPSLVYGFQKLLEYGSNSNDVGTVEDIFCCVFEISLPDPFGSRLKRMNEHKRMNLTEKTETHQKSLKTSGKSKLVVDFSGINKARSREYLVPDLNNHKKQFDRVFGNISRKQDIFESREICEYDPKRVAEIELVDGGVNIPVTEENRKEYVRLYLRYLVLEDVHDAVEKIRSGFMQATNGQTLNKISEYEYFKKVNDGDGINDIFQRKQSGLYYYMFGDSSTLDVKKWKSITYYDNGYTETSPEIMDFWEIVEEFSKEQKSKLLKFVTGNSFLPLGGYSNLTFVILKNGDPETGTLPTALTCFSRLLLPPYRPKSLMREKLLISIENCLGFGLL